VNDATLFWSKKRVLLTGHTGFKGCWLSIWLKALGAEVTGFSLPPSTSPNLFDVASVSSGINSVFGDIRNFEAVKEIVSSSKPEIIFHLAAQALVGRSYVDPVETYSTNVLGTVHLLEAARNMDCVRAIVNVTTDKCYLNKEWVWGYREGDSLGGHDPYSNSKACSELVSSAFSQSFFVDSPTSLATARAGNVIGGGDWTPGRLLPDVINSFDKKIPLLLRNPTAVRPWQHVLEPLSGYLLLAKRLYEDGALFEGAWNFGPHHEDARCVQWIVETVATNWGLDATWQADDKIHPHETNQLRLDISKATHQLDWKPKWSLPTALEQTVLWHNAWRNSVDMQRVCMDQIALYSEGLPSLDQASPVT